MMTRKYWDQSKNYLKVFTLIPIISYLIPITSDAPYLLRFLIKNENISNVLPKRYDIELAPSEEGGTNIFFIKLEINLTGE